MQECRGSSFEVACSPCLLYGWTWSQEWPCWVLGHRRAIENLAGASITGRMETEAVGVLH